MVAPSAHNINRAVAKILDSEARLIKVASRFHLTLRRSPLNVLLKLSKLNASRLNQVQLGLIRLIETFQVCATESVDPWDDREFFRLSMRGIAVSFPSDFIEKVDSEDLIEAYDSNRFQVFRNLRFMETTNYSLVEVLSYEWPELYDRARAITDELITLTDELLWTRNATLTVNVNKHFIREIRSFERQILEVQFKQIAPLFHGPGKPFGFVCSCRANALTSAGNLDNLSFV